MSQYHEGFWSLFFSSRFLIPYSNGRRREKKGKIKQRGTNKQKEAGHLGKESKEEGMTQRTEEQGIMVKKEEKGGEEGREGIGEVKKCHQHLFVYLYSRGGLGASGKGAKNV